MKDLIQTLQAKERRGSKPRCHLLTHGTAGEVAARLTSLIAPFGHVSASDRWMPQGFAQRQEAQLHKAPRLLEPGVSAQLGAWWLPAGGEDRRTPNFDIAGTCTIDCKPGLVLIEEKAHDEELRKECIGRTLKKDASEDRRASHKTIAVAIESARQGLEIATGQPWRIGRDTHYQMSNRFAWAWKLTDLGIPVVLVYLGFLNAEEMADLGKPFADHAEWERLVMAHSEPLFPAAVWGTRWMSNGRSFVPLISSREQPLE